MQKSNDLNELPKWAQCKKSKNSMDHTLTSIFVN